MSFKISCKTDNGSFKISLKRDVQAEEFSQIMQTANNLLYPQSIINSSASVVVVGVAPPPPAIIPSTSHNNFSTDTSHRLQMRLGQYPVNKIELGLYKEPKSGVRIRILSMPDHNDKKRIHAIRALREKTSISMMGCKEIIYGNYPCPIIKPEDADVIMQKFRELDVHAKVVRAEATG